MKLLSTATLATTLLSYVAADVSKVELHQKALKYFSARKTSSAFSRELDVSEECMTNQNEIQATGINDFMPGENQTDFLICDEEIKDGVRKKECDWDDADFKFDSAACTSAGGLVNKMYFEEECSGEFTDKELNIPHCLHDTCDKEKYYQQWEDKLNADDEFDCKFTVSGAAISSIHPAYVSEECMTNQDEIQATGINENILMFGGNQLSECVVVKTKEGVFKRECDWKSAPKSFSSCASAGGTIDFMDYEEECPENFYFNHKEKDVPYCRHLTCDKGGYYQMLEDDYQSNADEAGLNCTYEVTGKILKPARPVSGADIGSTSIISSIALVVSLFTILW